MHKCLYMICPTDKLESVIFHRFEGQKYFYSSLGNSVVLDKITLRQITALIQTEGINEISFVLSEDNLIVRDAVRTQKFSDIGGLKKLYNSIEQQKNQTIHPWQTCNQYAEFLSYYLTQRIEELQSRLQDFALNQPTIHAKLYSPDEDRFRAVYSDMFRVDTVQLN